MSVSRWEPSREVLSLQDAMDRLFAERFWPYRRSRGRVEGPCALDVDAYATPTEIVVFASVPGAEPKDVDVTIEGDTLTIKGEIRPPAEDVGYILQERTCGPFARSLRLNVPVQADKAEASFENGVLVLKIPKAEEVKIKTIKVKTK